MTTGTTSSENARIRTELLIPVLDSTISIPDLSLFSPDFYIIGLYYVPES